MCSLRVHWLRKLRVTGVSIALKYTMLLLQPAEISHQPWAFHVAMKTILALLAALGGRGGCSSVGGEDCQETEQTDLSLLQTHLLTSDRRAEAPHHWGSGRGNFPEYAVSTHAAPFKLSNTFAWQWHHPLGRFATLTYGTAIDAESNIYLSAADGVRKFDQNGVMIWEYGSLPAEVMNAPSLYNGMVYGSDTFGHVFALDMQTGKQVWKTKVADNIGQDNGFNMVREGVALTACDWRKPSPNAEANQKVKALNASTGQELWTYEPDTAVWNFLPLFVDESSFVFQDMTGKVYRLNLITGAVLWKAGGLNGTWTDGGAAVGPNGLVYAVNNNHPISLLMTESNPGTLSAYNISDGQLVWAVTTPRPPNNAPAVGHVMNLPGLSVVMPLCQQGLPGATCDVHVYDAETGGLQWIFHGPSQKGLLQAGDAEGILGRISRGVRSMCLPNGWSAPTIDSQGTVFVGNEEGNFYALRDLDGDGVTFGDGEVAYYDTKASFSGSSSPAIAPGILAIASCDTLFVFKG